MRYWRTLKRFENWFNFEMFENGGWKWIGGMLIGSILAKINLLLK